jgi:hypothetical protein
MTLEKLGRHRVSAMERTTTKVGSRLGFVREANWPPWKSHNPIETGRSISRESSHGSAPILVTHPAIDKHNKSRIVPLRLQQPCVNILRTLLKTKSATYCICSHVQTLSIPHTRAHTKREKKSVKLLHVLTYWPRQEPRTRTRPPGIAAARFGRSPPA